MKIKDRIGTSLVGFVYPYLQDYYRVRGEQMPKKADEREQFLLKEKYLWFLGQEDLLADFYQTRRIVSNLVDVRREYYYSNANNNIRIVHSGMPSLISYTKARIMGDVDVSIENDEKSSQTLEAICDDNNLNELIKNSIVTESWGKRFAWKISSDSEITEYPIIEKYDPMQYKTVYKRGRLQEIIFINPYMKGDTKYELRERYGLGYIKYELYMITSQNEIQVALTDLEETADLVDITWKQKIMLAGEKQLAKCDYDGIISEFDALDEAWSQLMDEIRLGRSEVYVPEILHQNQQFDKFRKNYTVLSTDDRENGKNQVEHIQPDIRTEEYVKAITAITSNILAAVGLSPFTVGIDDQIGANASGQALNRREMATIRTRDLMIPAWERFIEDMLGKVMFAYNGLNGKSVKEYNIDVKFEEYLTPTREEIINQTKLLVDASIIDNEKALDEVYGDTIEDEEKNRILANTGSITMDDTLDNSIDNPME